MEKSNLGQFAPASQEETGGDAAALIETYLELGMWLIRLLPNSKRPASSWKDQTTVRDAKTILGWLNCGSGVGIVFGPKGGDWYARDFDKAEAYDEWKKAYPDRAADLPTVMTKRGYHVYFQSCEAVPYVGLEKLGDGELRGTYANGTGAYCAAPPSQHAEGVEYTWIVPPTSQRYVNVALTGLDRRWLATERTDSRCVVSVLSELSVDRWQTSEENEHIQEIIEEYSVSENLMRNAAIFEFARRVCGLLGGRPHGRLRGGINEMWVNANFSKVSERSRDRMMLLTELDRAFDGVNKPNYGKRLPEQAADMLHEIDVPAFVPHSCVDDDDSPSVKLSKLIVALDYLSDGGVFYLSCGDAARLTGWGHKTTAGRFLQWLYRPSGPLELVERGTPGKLRGGRASRYRLKDEYRQFKDC